MKKNFIKSRIQSFGHAIHGWLHVVRTQKNAWIHAAATLLVFFLSIWLKLSLRDLAILTITVAVVWTAEFLNTALETIVDLACSEENPKAKIGKDVGAASVLIAAASAVAVGGYILGPPLLEKIRSIFNLIQSSF